MFILYLLVVLASSAKGGRSRDIRSHWATERPVHYEDIFHRPELPELTLRAGGRYLYGSGARTPQNLPPHNYHRPRLPHYPGSGWANWANPYPIPMGHIDMQSLPGWYNRQHYHPRPSTQPGTHNSVRTSGNLHRSKTPIVHENPDSDSDAPLDYGTGPFDDTQFDPEEGDEGCGGRCRAGEFLCSGSCTCIPVSWRCDGVADCVAGEDEAACSTSTIQQTCNPDTHIRCARTWKCIKKEWKCDGADDCGDFSDETHCGDAVNCTDDKFECNNGLCISANWLCDGENDCKDFSDEVNCTRKAECSEQEFRCGDGSCISLTFRCDMEPDCSDSSDETECPETEAVECGPHEILCSYPRCVREEYKCDGDDDCGDGSDEQDCPKKTQESCSPSEFQCENGKCILNKFRCDGERDCEGSEDELNCDYNSQRTCSPDEFACHKGYCILKAWVCDGVQDCTQGEDEMNCYVTCDPKTQFTCPPSNITSVLLPSFVHCIQKKHVCDDKKDCPRGEDELNCPRPIACAHSTKKCSQKCVETYEGRDACDCKPGYILDDDGVSCNDVDECSFDLDPVCSQTCRNTYGSYKCGCFSGYTLRPDGITCKAMGDPPTLLFANRIDIRQISLNNLRYTAVLKRLHNAIALDFHYTKGLIFWSDISMDAIRKARTNGTNVTDVMRWGLESPGGVSVDWIHDLLFWTDSGTRRVEVSGLDGQSRHVLASDDLDKPRAIAVHPGQAFVFWTDWGPKPKIERMEMDGSNRISLITESILRPNGLCVDYPSERIYWADAKHHVIESSKLDGSERRKVVTKGLPHPFALTLFEDALYWTDWHTKSISTASKATGTGFRTIHSGLHFPMDIHSFHPQRQPYFKNHCGTDNGGCSHLCLPNRDSFKCICPLGLKLHRNNRTCDHNDEDMLLFARKKDLRLRSLETGGAPNYDVVLPIDGIKSVVSIAWDSHNRKIIWTDTGAQAISSSKIDGQDQKEIVIDNLESPCGIAVDWVTNKLYWTDAGNKRVEVSNLDGSMRSLLIWDGLDQPRDITLDPYSGYMYWSDWGRLGRIERAGMDGLNRSVMVDSNVTLPNGLVVDRSSNRLYWTDSGHKTIEYVSLDGRNRGVLISNVPHPFGLAIIKDKIYWTDWETNSIHVANKRSPKESMVLRANLSRLMDLVIMGEERGIVSSKCNAANGGCSHLCLLAPNPEHYTCACPIGIKLMEDSKTCRSSPAVWLAVAHRKQIRQISLDMPYLVDVVMPFPVSKAVAIDYDRKTGDIFWSDTVEDVIKKAKPDGSGYETVIFDGLETVDGIAIDSAGRKLYWTDADSNSIQVCWLANCAEMRRALAWNHLDNPRAICLDYDMGLLFWSDWGNQPRIEQSDMDGNNRVTLISERLVWPNGLAVYKGRMYWTDAKLGTIETAPLSNTLNRSVLLRSLSHPYALVVLNDHIYWTDWKTQAIHRADRHSGNHTTAIVSNLDGLMDLRAIQPKELDPDVCGDNNGGCSHLCLRSPKSFTCTCPTGITLLEDGMTCRKQPKAFLLCAVKNSLVRISLDTPEMFDVKMPTPGIQKAVSVDFHWNKSALYYVDAQLNAIRGVSMDDPVRTWDIITNLTTPDGLAVDWLANNIYWTDLDKKTIEVAKLNGQAKKVIISELEEPRSLALYPHRGYIYWTDWGEAPRIERSYMDGTDRKVIVKDDLKFPNGLSIDFHAEKLYWADALKDRIEMSELNGSGRTQLIPEATNPFGLTQHGDHIYWMDWNKKGVERAEASTGRERTILKARVHGVMEIKAVAKERQPGTNPCSIENGHCSHLCFYRGRHGYVCACPDIMDTTCSIKPSQWVPNAWHPEDGEEFASPKEDTTLPPPSSPVLTITVVIIGLVVFAALSIPVCLVYHRKQREKKYAYPGGRVNFSDYSEAKGDNQSKAYLWNKLRYDKSQERVFAVSSDKGGDIVSLIPAPVSPALSTTPTSSIALEHNDRSTSIC